MAKATRRSPVSSAYASALLEIGETAKQSEEYAAHLAAFTEALAADKILRIFFESPKIARSDKKAALDRALGEKVAAPVLNTLKLLIDRGRQMLFGEIADVFGEMLDETRGRMNVEITSSSALSDVARTRLVTLLHERLGREIVTRERVDAGLLGGMTVRVGDTVIDGSLRTKLKRVREAMTLPRLGRDLFE